MSLDALIASLDKTINDIQKTIDAVSPPPPLPQTGGGGGGGKVKGKASTTGKATAAGGGGGAGAGAGAGGGGGVVSAEAIALLMEDMNELEKVKNGCDDVHIPKAVIGLMNTTGNLDSYVTEVAQTVLQTKKSAEAKKADLELFKTELGKRPLQ